MASQVSLPSTPQQNTTYDTYMQSLQQKLSSISMQNAATLLHVDSSAPTSGTTTTEMLSPVQEFETTTTTTINAQSPNDTPKHHQNNSCYKNLNNELTKINSSRTNEPINNNIDEQLQIQTQTEIKEINNEISTPVVQQVQEKTRRVSRFKVSVVVEPDPTKLIIKPMVAEDTNTPATAGEVTETNIKEEIDLNLKQVPSLQDIPSSLEGALETENNIKFINNTMLQLQENIQTSYLAQVKTINASVPSGWTTQNNETFEDMLARQQAELNALIEAHRKQQIEYMKSITDVSKTSNNNSNSNRKDNF